jgi:hypothetical protein
MEHTIDLDTLTEDQKRGLYATLAMSYGRPNAKNVEFTADETLIWDAINGIIGQRRQLGDVLVKCGKDYTRASFGDDVEYVCRWLDQGCGTKVTRTQRRAIVDCAMECLAKRIGRLRNKDGDAVPVIHKTMIQQLASIPAAVDRAFPSYQEARLLDRVAAIAA